MNMIYLVYLFIGIVAVWSVYRYTFIPFFHEKLCSNLYVMASDLEYKVIDGELTKEYAVLAFELADNIRKIRNIKNVGFFEFLYIMRKCRQNENSSSRDSYLKGNGILTDYYYRAFIVMLLMLFLNSPLMFGSFYFIHAIIGVLKRKRPIDKYRDDIDLTCVSYA